MAKDPAFLFYSSDFYMGTEEMTDAQVGQYIRLMCLQHQKRRLSEALMKKVMGGVIDPCVASKFVHDEDGYYNLRLDEEAEKRRKYSESRSKNRTKAVETPEKKISIINTDNEETHLKDMNCSSGRRDTVCNSYDTDMKNICNSYEKHMVNENEDTTTTTTNIVIKDTGVVGGGKDPFELTEEEVKHHRELVDRLDAKATSYGLPFTVGDIERCLRWAGEYSEDWLLAAIERCSLREKRSWGMVHGILKSWTSKGGIDYTGQKALSQNNKKPVTWD